MWAVWDGTSGRGCLDMVFVGCTKLTSCAVSVWAALDVPCASLSHEHRVDASISVANVRLALLDQHVIPCENRSKLISSCCRCISTPLVFRTTLSTGRAKVVSQCTLRLCVCCMHPQVHTCCTAAALTHHPWTRCRSVGVCLDRPVPCHVMPCLNLSPNIRAMHLRIVSIHVHGAARRCVFN